MRQGQKYIRDESRLLLYFYNSISQVFGDLLQARNRESTDWFFPFESPSGLLKLVSIITCNGQPRRHTREWVVLSHLARELLFQ